MFPARFKSLARGLAGVFLLALLVMPGLAQDDADTIYTAPDGSFTVTIPARWADESTDDYGKFTLEDGSVLYLLPVAADEVQAGIAAALAVIDPEFDLPAVQTIDLPTPDRIWTQNVYAAADGAISAALGTVEGEATYVIYLVSPGAAEITAASPDLNMILLSFQSAGGLDLTDAAPADYDATMSADLEAYVAQALTDFNVPGAAVAIVQDGEVVYSNGFGVRELEGEAVDADTLFMIGSQTKSMTTLVMASLVDEEDFAWDTPVTEIYPDFALADPEVTAQIRMRDLVNNSSGVPRYDFPLAFKNQTPEELIASLSTIPLVSPYGEKFNYSNQMVAAAGYIAALAHGASEDSLYEGYVQLVQERIFDPLGMTRSTIDFDTALADENHALPYAVDYETDEIVSVPLQSERFVIPIAPAGAVWSSANEMAQYLLMAMNNGIAPDGTVLASAANFAETQKPGVAIETGGAYAMGWMVDEYNGIPTIFHGGNTGGFTFELNYLPDVDFGVIVLVNRGLANNFSGAVSTYIFEQVYGLDHVAGGRYLLAEDQLSIMLNSILATMPAAEFDPESVADFVGDYEYALEIFINDDGELAFTSDFNEGTFIPMFEPANAYLAAGSGLLLQFAKSDDGEVTATLSSLIDPSQVFTMKKLAE